MTRVSRLCSCAVLLLSLTTACSNPAAPENQGPAPPSVKQFVGLLDPGGFQFFSFTVANIGTTELTLQVLRPADTPLPALSTPLTLMVGTPLGESCSSPLNELVVQPALVPQISIPTTPNTYCAALSDPAGQLPLSAYFSVRIVHP